MTDCIILASNNIEQLKVNISIFSARPLAALLTVFCFLQMWLCGGNGAQVHNSERDPETGTATGETPLCFAECNHLEGCLETAKWCVNVWCHFQAIKVVQYNINTEELYVILKEFIHLLYFRWDSAAVSKCLNILFYRTYTAFSWKMEWSSLIESMFVLPFVSIRHLLVNPRDRRVVIIESILCPSHFRETLTKVFFKQFEVWKPSRSVFYRSCRTRFEEVLMHVRNLLV